MVTWSHVTWLGFPFFSVTWSPFSISTGSSCTNAFCSTQAICLFCKIHKWRHHWHHHDVIMTHPETIIRQQKNSKKKEIYLQTKKLKNFHQFKITCLVYSEITWSDCHVTNESLMSHRISLWRHDDRFDLYPLNQVELECGKLRPRPTYANLDSTNHESSIYHCDKNIIW